MTGAVVLRGTVITMDPTRRVIDDGAVVIDGSTITSVGPRRDVVEANPGLEIRGSATDLVTPGYINGHQHLTGDRLIQSSIPDNLPPGEAIFSWVVPVHDKHTEANDELSATLSLAEALGNGITTTFEAGTIANPDRVVQAARRLGARLTVGTWGWDIDEGPFVGPVDEVLHRQRLLIQSNSGPLVTPWVCLVGHELMSDELVVGAADLARSHGVGLTFHLSPTEADPQSYLARTGKRPLVHLADLSVLGPNVAVAHAVHIDQSEIEALIQNEAAVVSCPWAYLRLGQGVSNQFRHLQFWENGGRLALGCDSENAGDMVDGIRIAALFAGLAKDVPADPIGFGAYDALELLTIRGAEALGIGDRVGSIEVGKEADIVVHDRNGVEWIPISPDPVLQLVWGADGRSVRDVYVAGSQVVADGSVLGVDLASLASEAAAASADLRRRAGIS